MRRILVTASTFALLAAPAFAADDLMASRYGNTTIAKGSGPEVHLYYKADGTFSGKVLGMTIPLKGTWKLDGTTMCQTYNPPPPGAKNPLCVTVDPHQVGDSWTDGKRTISIVQGIQ
jgi:hypothetical protein